MKENSIKIESGFTLLEMMIAVSLFTVVMLISSSMFLSSIDSQSRAIGSKNIQESLNFALASMSNEIAKAVVDPGPCDGRCDGASVFCVLGSGLEKKIIFKELDNTCIAYQLTTFSSDVRVLSMSRDGLTPVYLTPRNINISDLNFNTEYVTNVTNYIAKASVSITGQGLNRENHPDIVSIQTLVTVGNY
ncbi:MAG: prepilin-type N-terminal cleavage/methylation domain-containing protein [Candidatus Falkowbacteria bacterium]|nr:prepilin-type N-terminal cleavage/methylation domain-containing protein [Candidatus Falkowbacteria bacterium]